MKDVRKAIEEDVHCTVKSLKFGYAICVCTKEDIAKYGHNPDIENLITIALWRKNNGYLMIKQVDETMGPCQVDIPLKYVRTVCKATINSNYACEWRHKVELYHRHVRAINRLVKCMSRGDRFFVYGDLFQYQSLYRSNKILAIDCNTGKQYSIRYNQISMQA